MIAKLKFNSKKKKSVNEKYEEVHEYSVDLIHHSKIIELLSIKDNLIDYISESTVRHRVINPEGNDESIILHRSNNSRFTKYIERNINGNNLLAISILVFKIVTNDIISILQIAARNPNIYIICEDRDIYYISGSYYDFYNLDSDNNPIIPIIKSIIDPDIFIQKYIIDSTFDKELKSDQIQLLDNYTFDKDTKLKSLDYVIFYINGNQKALINDIIFNYANKSIYFDKESDGIIVFIKISDLYAIYKNTSNIDNEIIIGTFLDNLKHNNYTINYSDNNIEDNDQYYENIDEIID